MPRRSSSTSNNDQEAGPSRSPTSPTSPNSGTGPGPGTRPISTYPPEIYGYDPRTPSHHRRSLGRVDESPDLDISPSSGHEQTGHRGSFVARDYVDGPGTYPYANSPQSMTASNANTADYSHRDDGGNRASMDEGFAEFTDSRKPVRTGNDTRSESGDEDNEESISNRPPSMTTAPSIRRDRIDSIDQPFPPELVPPPSVHDTYLSQYIQPIVPTSSARPSAPRSTSVPVLETAGAGGNGLLPPVNLREDAQHEQTHNQAGLNGHGSGSKPIFEIFDAEPGSGGREMVSALKGHLEEVLKVQEEIGKMHLALEGLDGGNGDMNLGQDEKTKYKAGTEGQDDEEEIEVDDSLSRREKGMEALMERLGHLSSTLRTYHDLGTPKLQFPSSHKPFSPTSGLEQEGQTSPTHPSMNRQHSAHPDLGFTPNKDHTQHIHQSHSPRSGSSHAAAHPHSGPSGTSGSQGTMFPKSPLVHKGVDSLRRQEGVNSPLVPGPGPGQGQGSGSGTGGDQRDITRKSSVNSDLPDLPLKFPKDQSVRRKPSLSHQDLTALRRDYNFDEAKSRGTGSQRGQKRFDSPIEMVDRSRPW